MPRRAALTRKRARPPCAPWELIPIASNPVFPQYRADPLYCSQRGVSVHVRKTGAVQLGRGTWDDLSARLHRPLAERGKQAELVARFNRLEQLIERTFSARKPS